MALTHVTKRRAIQAAILLAIGALLLYGIVRTVHPDQVGDAIRRASLGWVILGALSSIGFIAIRSVRWQLMLATSGDHVRLTDAAAVTAAGFAVNSVSPFKLGEFLRIGLIADRTGIGVGEAGATVVLERILDVLALLVLAIAAALLSGTRSGAGGMWQGLTVLSVISIVVGVAGYLMARNPEWTLSLVRRLSGRLPARLQRPLIDLAASALRGLALLQAPGRFAICGVLSLAIWIVPTLGLVAYVRSITGALSFPTLYLALTLFVISQAVSVTPASVGTFEGLFVLILSAFDAGPASQLTAIAVIAHVAGIAALLFCGALGALWLRVDQGTVHVRTQAAMPH